MAILKLTAIAALIATPVVATVADTNAQVVPQRVELSVEERGNKIAALSVEERTHVIAGFDPDERKNQIG